MNMYSHFNHQGKLEYPVMAHLVLGFRQKLSRATASPERKKWIPENELRWLKYLLVILECSPEGGNLSIGYHPQLLHTSRYQMLVVTDLQFEEHMCIELIPRKHKVTIALVSFFGKDNRNEESWRKEDGIPWVLLLGTEQDLESVPPQHPDPKFEHHCIAGSDGFPQ